MSEYIHCKLCPSQWLVSKEDPDSTADDAFHHVARRHPGADPYTQTAEGQSPATVRTFAEGKLS